MSQVGGDSGSNRDGAFSWEKVGAEDREALAMEGMRQGQGLSLDRQGRDLGIERGRDGPDIG